MKFVYPLGATPLNDHDASQLIPLHITNMAQLDEWEAENILQAIEWLRARFATLNLLDISFCKQLHKKMFDQTWEWAGKFRTSQTNIGVAPSLISTELKKLFDDVIYQLKKHSFDIDEIALRLHHRLVSIHPFSNGNGRHARLFTELLLEQNGKERFSWGESLGSKEEVRQSYLDALREADKHNYKLLAAFVRS